jgi:hypothetical protein
MSKKHLFQAPKTSTPFDFCHIMVRRAAILRASFAHPA